MEWNKVLIKTSQLYVADGDGMCVWAGGGGHFMGMGEMVGGGGVT